MSFIFMKSPFETLRLGLLILWLFALQQQAHPQDAVPVVKEEYISASDVITVEKDGSYSVEWQTTRRLLDASGRDSFATKTFSFNDQLASLDIIEAETIKADGRRIQVQPDQIRLQEDPAATGLPVFSTSKQKTIIFPDIEVGDSVRYRARKIQREPDFPGHFAYADSFAPDERVLAYTLVLKAPKSLGLRSEALAMNEVRATDEKGDDVWSWSFAQPDTRPLDHGKADVFMNSPHIIVTSFADWNAIAQAYRARADDKLAVTPEIQALADELTKDVPGRREQVQRIYNWVRGNIRYVALYLAQGGYVPHSAGDILRNRYGDCKDHVVLLEALLRARGIESHGALIASGDLFSLPSEALPGYFDHIISYVPEFDLYLDSTAEYLPFGLKGYWLSSKAVLHVDGLTGIRTTPAMTAQENSLSTSTTWSLDMDGSLHGRIVEISRGGISIDRRRAVAGIDPLQRAGLVQQLLARNGLKGRGSYTADDPKSDERDYRIDIDFTIDQTGLDLSGPEAFAITPPLALGYSIPDMTSFAMERPEPLYATACAAVELDDTYDGTIPEGVGVRSLPKSVSLAEGPIRYDAAYAAEGQKIHARRHYVMPIDRGYCTPKDVEQMAEAVGKVRQDLQRKVLLAPAGD
ncbi:transglutaminase superfamily protein [Phyllobacterium myrsinacearum]|nr:transglutaminase superfamily protein [Phyllobacterium myrsinacearum]